MPRKSEFEELGIEDLKIMVSFLVSMANAVGRSLEDGDVSVWDVRHFIDPASLAIPAFRNAGDALKQFDDMDDIEKQEIYEHIDELFDLEFDHVEEYVQKALKAAVALGDLVCDTIDKFGYDPAADDDDES